MKRKTNLLVRAAMTLLLAVLFSIGTWAEDVTPEQAMEQAQSFIKKREVAGSRQWRTLGTATPQLVMARQVSGLYVFNVADNGGFVIVSNDDRTVPILGYSDEGYIDPDHMPDNMRAWLQGYADQIAWMQQNNITVAAAARGDAPRRVGTHSTDAINPLLTTTWNQGEPYNGDCPTINYNSSDYSCVTGCVATAMAQVMNYHQYPSETTKAIPGYTSTVYQLEPLDSTAFNWTNMQDSDIAKLMQYCGWSVQMQYGIFDSQTQTVNAAVALKEYFGYNATTQYVSRSYYSYANWTDMIYHELAQGRPVIYGGQSVDNGHCFVCDGYKCEESTDLFHINWGWGGQSDGYFVLSVLNPAEQGIGGSASNSAYDFGQEAIVGIQKSTDNGTVQSNPNTVSLTFNSISLSSSSIAWGEPVDVTVNVTNNSNVAYDGEIALNINNGMGIGKMFEIAAGATQNCVITFTPSENVGNSQTLIPVYPAGGGQYAGNGNVSTTLTLVNQTPTSLTASDVSSTSAAVGWTNVGNATNWNLRYCPLTDQLENFNTGSVTGWRVFDINNDGYSWLLQEGVGIGKSIGFLSPSYYGEFLTPDDWLITPEVPLKGTFSFYAWGAGETFSVAVSTDDANYYAISSTQTATSTPTKYSFDLSGYSGLGYIAIIHNTPTNLGHDSFLFVDDVTYPVPSGTWTTTVSPVTSSPHTLTGLRPNTNYMVQAQAVNSYGGYWSAPVIFTTGNQLTLANNDGSATPNNASLLDTWNGVTANVTLSGRTLQTGSYNSFAVPFDVSAEQLKATLGTDVKVKKLTGSSLSGSTLTLTFADATSLEAGKPYLVKVSANKANPVFSGVVVSNVVTPTTTDAVDFVPTVGRTLITGPTGSESDAQCVLFLGGQNKLYHPSAVNTSNNDASYINAFRAYFQLKDGSAARTIRMDLGEDEETTEIDDAQCLKYKEQGINSEWYSLDGRRLTGEPTKKGVYVINGTKHVIK